MTPRTFAAAPAVLTVLVLLAAIAHSAEARKHRKLIACSPFVYPCQCGLCPHIVDCATKVSAECFCGTAAPGTYRHPEDKTKFWMCSYDSTAQVKYGVEVACPARLVFDPVVKVCTFPDAAAKSAATAANATGTVSVAAGATTAGFSKPAGLLPGAAVPAGSKAVLAHKPGGALVQSKVAQNQALSTIKVMAAERAQVARKP